MIQARKTIKLGDRALTDPGGGEGGVREACLWREYDSSKPGQANVGTGPAGCFLFVNTSSPTVLPAQLLDPWEPLAVCVDQNTPPTTAKLEDLSRYLAVLLSLPSLLCVTSDKTFSSLGLSWNVSNSTFTELI